MCAPDSTLVGAMGGNDPQQSCIYLHGFDCLLQQHIPVIASHSSSYFSIRQIGHTEK